MLRFQLAELNLDGRVLRTLRCRQCDVAATRAAIFSSRQGEGGFYIAPKDFVVRLRELCDRHGILLVADEIQSGAGRTGKMFAIEHFGVAADLYTLAKSLGGGFPLSAVVGRADVMDACGPGGLGGTYAGNPVACAAALAVLEVGEQEGSRGASGSGKVARLSTRCVSAPGDSRVRRLGAMIAFELGEGGRSASPGRRLRKTDGAGRNSG